MTEEPTTAPKADANNTETAPPKAKAGEPRMAPVANDTEDFDLASFEEQAGLYEESFRDLEENEVVAGTVVAVNADEVLVDVGYKSEGTISLAEFGQGAEVAVGDKVDVYLEKKEDQDGVIVLSKEKADFFRAWDRVREIYEAGGSVDGKILNRVRGGFIVDIGVKAFLPASQLDLRPVRDYASYLKQTFPMRIIKVNKRRRNIVLSRKALLLEEREVKKKLLLEKMEKGIKLEGEVKNITDFGAFVDLGGLDGLLHITDLSWGRVKHPSEVVSIGQRLEVLVTDFDPTTGRVSLSLKDLLGNPWDNIGTRYHEGERVIGKVVSIVDYGAFVELEAGVEGLVHVSEMSWTQRIKHPSKILSVGDEIGVVVLKIDESNRRISLGLRQTMPNPWDTIEERHPPGAVIEGTVRNITDFGVFVELEEGIDGLIHISDISWKKRIRHPSDVFKKGDRVTAAVLTIDSVNRRISLGVKQLEHDPWTEVEERYPVGSYAEGAVVRITAYGAIVKLEEDIEGLLHISEVAGRRVNKVEDVLAIGDRIKVKVINVSPRDRRINLSLWQYQNETGNKGIEEGAALEEIQAAAAAAEAVEEPPVDAPAEELATGDVDAAKDVEGVTAEGVAEAVEEPPAEAPAEELATEDVGAAKDVEGVTAEGVAEEVHEPPVDAPAEELATLEEAPHAGEAENAEAEATPASLESPSEEESAVEAPDAEPEKPAAAPELPEGEGG